MTPQTSCFRPPSGAFVIDYHNRRANLRGLHDCFRLTFVLARLLFNGFFGQ